MTKTFKLVLLAAYLLIFSCEENGLIVHCPDCTIGQPIDTDLELQLDKNNDGSQIKILLYVGNIEDSVLYDTFHSLRSTYKIRVTINKKYTATATYNMGGKTYVAIDSATPRIKFDKDQCDDPCYYVYDKKCDLRIKYTK